MEKVVETTAQRMMEQLPLEKGSGATLPQPVITFQGNQGYIKIPSPIAGSDDRVRVFAFYLSREIKDKPQSSFECIRQGTTWTGEKHLSCIGTIQDKITVCATDESYQLTRDRVSQVEKESWSRTAIEIKPEVSHRSKCLKIPGKSTAESNTESPPPVPRPPVFLTPAAKKCNRVNGERRPLQEWLIQLLALKPYRKHDLIMRLEKSNTFPRDQMELLSALDVVGQLNPKDGKYCLREDLYSQVQKDWMGYTPEERQHLAGILSSRKYPNISSSQNEQTATERVKTQHSPSFFHHSARPRPPDTKRPLGVDASDNENCKRVKSSSMDGDPHKRQSSSSSGLHMNSRHQTGSEIAKNLTTVSANHNVLSSQNYKKHSTHQTLHKSHHSETHRRDKTCDVSKTGKSKHREPTAPVSQRDSRADCVKQEQRVQDSSEEEEEEEDWEEEALLLERCLTSPEEKEDTSEAALPSEEVPDYFNKYSTITSEEQRKMYEEEFASDHSEYLELHSKIGKVLERFVQLGSRMKKYQPGTVEYKVVENKIVSEYKKVKKTYPRYSEEKSRCEYLHHKLSHIKHLILEYEKNTPT
ncbi:RNA polymerase II elongation factor ELL3 isoform X2 [Hyperolius riggenbachi]|uniref:RNA polymerase II elongation factor ELL3 isoform X2 n=1 Tax=Hyperolius riggenbachi TaxID=752182 RepID=UPI0035A39450